MDCSCSKKKGSSHVRLFQSLINLSEGCPALPPKCRLSEVITPFSKYVSRKDVDLKIWQHVQDTLGIYMLLG